MSKELETKLRAELKAAGVRPPANASLAKLQELAAGLNSDADDAQDEEATAAVVSKPAPTPKPAAAGQELVVINIAPGVGDDYNPVYLNHAGKEYMLPRDKDVVVSKDVYDWLSSRCEPRIVISTGSDGQMIQQYRSVKRFPMTCRPYVEGEVLNQ
jgi:hypothetical protein